MTDDNELLKLLQQHNQEDGKADKDAYDCGLVISNPQGLSIIQAKYNDQTAELIIQPKRFWHEGAHDLELILNKYRKEGYRVEFVGAEDGDRVYAIMRTHLILSSVNLVRMIMEWLRRNNYP